MFPFSLGSFAFVDDLDDCSSATETFVERRPSHHSQPHPKHEEREKKEESKRSKSKTDTTRDGKRRSSNAADTRLNGSKSLDTAERSTATAPGRDTRKRSSTRKSDIHTDKLKADDDRTRLDSNDDTIVGDRLSAKISDRPSSRTRTRARSRETGRETLRPSEPTERIAKTEPTPDDVRKDNRTLRRRIERLEKDLGSYRQHVEHYRERRREAELERVKAEGHSKELEQVVENMRESYDREMDDLREQMARAASTAAAAAVATVSAEAYVQAQTTGPSTSVREPSVHAPSSRRAPSHRAPSLAPSHHAPSLAPSHRAPSLAPSHRAPNLAPSHTGFSSVHALHHRNPSLHEHAVQTSPMPVPVQLPQILRSHPATPFTMPKPLAAVAEAAPSTLLLQLEERDAELRALKLFHDEKPQMLLSEFAQASFKLNAEIRSLSAAVSESVPLGRTWEVAQAWALEAADPSLEVCLDILSGVKGADFAKDPTIVRLALQAWVVLCLQNVFDRFLFGLEDTEDETFRIVYDRLQARDSLTVAARWRALTRKHARILAARVADSPKNNFRVAQAQAIYTLETQILVGFRDIMRFAGAHSAPGDLLIELRRQHSHQINRCVCRAVKLARDLAERAPTGCEVFTVSSRRIDARKRAPPRSGIPQTDIFLCGCMESADTECRQWVGQRKRKHRGTHRSTTTTRSKTTQKSRSGTATTRTWADTHIRQWDRDSDEDGDEAFNSDSEDEIELGEHEDEWVESVDEDRYGDGKVLCSLGFGLRRVMSIEKPQTRAGTSMARSISGETRDTRDTMAEFEREKRREHRSRQPKAETVVDSELKSTYTKLTTTLSSALSSSAASDDLTERTERPARTQTSSAGARAFTDNTGGVQKPLRRTIEVLVKTDVLMSSTLSALQRRFA